MNKLNLIELGTLDQNTHGGTVGAPDSFVSPTYQEL